MSSSDRFSNVVHYLSRKNGLFYLHSFFYRNRISGWTSAFIFERKYFSLPPPERKMFGGSNLVLSPSLIALYRSFSLKSFAERRFFSSLGTHYRQNKKKRKKSNSNRHLSFRAFNGCWNELYGENNLSFFPGEIFPFSQSEISPTRQQTETYGGAADIAPFAILQVNPSQSSPHLDFWHIWDLKTFN